MLNNNESSLWDKKYKNSREYQNIEDVFKFSKNNPSVSAIIPYIKKGCSILEIGSGTGELISYLGHAYPDCKTTGIDFSAESVAHSNNIVATFNLHTSFVKGDIERMPFADESFDIVFGDQVLGHLDTISVALKEIYRITKKDGIVAFTAANSLRPDGWYLHKNLSQKHEGYKQVSMTPWTLKKHLSRAQFTHLYFYGDILILSRNISLIKNFFLKQKKLIKTEQTQVVLDSKKSSFLKKIYLYLNSKIPNYMKVTIGILAKK